MAEKIGKAVATQLAGRRPRCQTRGCSIFPGPRLRVFELAKLSASDRGPCCRIARKTRPMKAKIQITASCSLSDGETWRQSGKPCSERPGLVNVVAAHPFWGGRPQPLHVAVETNRHDVFEFLLEGRRGSRWRKPGLRQLVALDAGIVQRTLRNDRNDWWARALPSGCARRCSSADDDRLETLLAESGIPPATARPSGSLLALARTETAIERLLTLGVSTDGERPLGRRRHGSAFEPSWTDGTGTS